MEGFSLVALVVCGLAPGKFQFHQGTSECCLHSLFGQKSTTVTAQLPRCIANDVIESPNALKHFRIVYI